MSTLIGNILLLSTLGGYGDVDTEGYPSYGEREAHLWVNHARVAPHSFEQTYSEFGCSSYADFSKEEEVGQVPLFYHNGLNRAARFHTQDMASTGKLSSDSSDGTPMEQRVAEYYTGKVAETIDGGDDDAWSSIIGTWMCDPDARAIIMSPSYTELGTGTQDGWFTADFGVNITTETSPIRAGIHTPELPVTEVDFLVDWGDLDRPASIQAVVDGEQHLLSLKYGAESQGIYGVNMDAPEGSCHEYYFRWAGNNGESGYFPAEGSYLYGDGCTQAHGWRDGRLGGNPPKTAEQLLEPVRLTGCASTGGLTPKRAGLSLIFTSLLCLVSRSRRKKRSAAGS